MEQEEPRNGYYQLSDDMQQQGMNYGNYGGGGNYGGNYGNVEDKSFYDENGNNYGNYGGGGKNDGNYGNYAEEEPNGPAYEAKVADNAGAPVSRHPPPPPPRPLIAQKKREWAAELCSLRQILDTSERRKRLAEWHEALVKTAVGHAGNIVDALRDPVKLAAMTAEMGGVAGGTKFVFDGIVFKLATDPRVGSQYLYGQGQFPSPERAAKAASQELKGANALFECLYEQKVNITVPMQVLIDYCGERLVAMPLLPINTKDTLVYGSNDGGKKVVADPQFHDQLAGVCAQLHLAEHLVASSEGPTKLWLAGDVEGHRGTDGRLYLLDLARTFPPEDPRLSCHLPPSTSAVWFRLIRPELLRILKQQKLPPLSSDSFTKWGSLDLSHNRNARSATEFLLNEQIPRFAWHLSSFLNSPALGPNSLLRRCFNPFPESYARTLLRQPITAEAFFTALVSHTGQAHKVPDWADHTTFYPENYLDTLDLSKEFHDSGIPMRHLGLVLEEVRSGELKAKLLREAVARSLKNLIRSELRQCRGAGMESTTITRQKKGQQQQPIDIVLEWFNAVLRGPAILQNRLKASEQEVGIVQEIWEKVLPADIAERFGSILVSNMTSITIAAEPHRAWILSYLIGAIGVSITQHCRDHKLVSDELCPNSHALVSQVPEAKQEVTCNICRARAYGTVRACVVCKFSKCSRCAGTELTSFTKEDVIGFTPRKKFMSFMNAINAQLLSDHAVLLVKSMADTRQAEFLDLMQRVTALCENLLRTDPTCVSIKEQLRYARMAVSVLYKGGSAIEKRSVTDTFLRNLLAEINDSTGNMSDGLKLVIAAGAIGDLQLVVKATKFQNLGPLRALVDEGGEIGNAVAYAIDFGNRGAVALLLHEMKRRFATPPFMPKIHLYRRKMFSSRRLGGVRYTFCTVSHASRLVCMECAQENCDHKFNSISQTPPLCTNALHFHQVFDPSVHPHPLAVQFPPNPLPCTLCKKSQILWHCRACQLQAGGQRSFAVCSDCVEPDVYSYPHPILAPIEAGMIDDAMLATISWGLRDNHAFSSVFLVECFASPTGCAEFFRQTRFASSLTNLDFSGNALDTPGVRALSSALVQMNLKTLCLRAMKGTFHKDVDIFVEGLKQTQIEDLDLSGNPLADSFVEELKQAKGSPFLRSIRRLILKNTGFTLKGLTEFLSLGLQLEAFRVSHNKIGDEGSLLLASMPVEYLSIVNTGLTEAYHDRVAEALGDNPTLKAVKVIDTKKLDLYAIRQAQAPKMYCPEGDELVRGATTPRAHCAACARLSSAIYACPRCGHALCHLCTNNSTFAAELGVPKLLDARSCVDDFCSMIVARTCARLDYKYLEFHDRPIIPFVDSLVALDLRQRKCLESVTVFTLNARMTDSLRRVHIMFEYSRNSGYSTSDLLVALTGRPNLTDVTLVNPPLNAKLFEFLRHGQKLERLDLSWPYSHETEPLTTFALLPIGQYCVSLKFLKLKGMHFVEAVKPYVGQADHPFHCLTIASEVRVTDANMSHAARTTFVQALSFNKGLSSLTIRFLFDSSLSEEATAVSLAEMFKNCQQLKYVKFCRLFNRNSSEHGFLDKFAQVTVPALIANPSIETLRLHPNDQGVATALMALANRPGMVNLMMLERYEPLPGLPDLVVALAPKLSGLTIREEHFPAEELAKCLRAILATGKAECKQREGPLRVLAIGRPDTDINPEVVTLCQELFPNPILAVSELCLHGLDIPPEWFAALKQSPHITKLDLSGSTRFDFNLLVDAVAHMPKLTYLNISGRKPEGGNGASYVLSIIKNNPQLQRLHATLDYNAAVSNQDVCNVITAALSPDSSLRCLEFPPQNREYPAEIAFQELLWRSAKPLLYFPLPDGPQARVLHWARMDRLGSPCLSIRPKCHVGPW